MKLVIEREALTRALTRAGRVSPGRNTIPILGNLLLVARDGMLTVTATDLDMWLSDSAPARIEDAGEITVPASALTDIARKLPNGAEVLLETTDTQIRIQCGRSRFMLHALPAEDFPAINLMPLPHEFQVPCSTLAHLIVKTQFAISTEETRYYLNGVFLHPAERDGRMYLRGVATDGHRLSRCDEALPIGAENMPGIIVPRKAVTEIAKLTESPDAEAGIAASERQLRVTVGTASITTKLVDGTFPDYRRVIPTGHTVLARLDRETVTQVLGRVTSVSSSRGNAVKCLFDQRGATLSVHNSDLGDSEESMDGQCDGLITIGFNGKYFAEALGVLPGKTLSLAMNDPGGPAVLREDAGTGELLIVLMPMRV